MAVLDPRPFRSTDSLLASHQQLRAIFNQAAVGIALASLDGHFVDLNRRFSEILGYSEAELHNMTFSELTHPDDRAVTEAFVRQLLAGEIPEYTLEKRYLCKGGGEIWSLTTVTLMRDAAGQPDRFIGVIEDITQRKNAETALHEERRILEILNETGKLLASQLDLQSLVQAVTDAATQLSGAQFGSFFYNVTDENGDAFLLYTLSGAPREAFANFGNPRATALFGPTFRGEPPIRLDDVLADPRYGTLTPHHGMPKGHLPVRSYLAVPVRGRNREVLGGLFFGHSEVGVFTADHERLAEGVATWAAVALENARLYKAVREASQLKDEFLATLSHELRTPLNAILGYARMLRSGQIEVTKQDRAIEIIERNATSLAQIVEDVLDVSRITAGKVVLNLQPTDPAEIIRNSILSVAPAAEARGVQIDTFVHPDVGQILADADRLQQVLWNLLSNAVKFTGRGGRVHVQLQRSEGVVEIVVSDTGIGIPAEFLPFLFDRFRQADSKTTREQGGLGLGLAIARNFIEMHGGTISASSPGEGEGSTFRVILPVMMPIEPAKDSERPL